MLSITGRRLLRRMMTRKRGIKSPCARRSHRRRGHRPRILLLLLLLSVTRPGRSTPTGTRTQHPPPLIPLILPLPLIPPLSPRTCQRLNTSGTRKRRTRRPRRPPTPDTPPSTTRTPLALPFAIHTNPLGSLCSARAVIPPRLVSILGVLALVPLLLFLGQGLPLLLAFLGFFAPLLADDFRDFGVGQARVGLDYCGLMVLAVEDECCQTLVNTISLCSRGKALE